ncbi:MAG: DUF418 domain-containing protein [Gammaproteobacteria bacterium]|uniref:DUF418 domain-containing protein n=1 Tax=Pseudomonas sp. Hp2 TaxID=701189 RepID=UPI00112AD4C4|nr:DUF418 domain-containing protein [Pseudomonas sp. Hp2]
MSADRSLPLVHATADSRRARPRHELIDALRGFALLGVFLVNLTFLSLYALLPEDQRASLATAKSDGIVALAMSWLVDVKAITVFSLLFGLGFALQMERGEAGGTRRHFRRMLGLAAIGIVHGWFIWWGDILFTYAVVGLFLPVFRRAGACTLIVLGLTFALLLPPLMSSWVRPLLQGLPRAGEVYAQALQAFGFGSWSDVLLQNIATARWARVANWALLLFVLGRFLLGYWAGRVGLLQEPRRHRALLWRLFVGALIVGVLAMLVETFQTTWRQQFPLLNSEFCKYAIRVVMRAAPLALGVAGACGFVLLYLFEPAQRWLCRLAPVGRMALTHYLLQSVIGIVLFYGIGLGIGPGPGLAAIMVVGAVIFVLQVIASHAWLRHFQFGPVEWLWRWFTYGRRPGLRRSALPVNKVDVA